MQWGYPPDTGEKQGKIDIIVGGQFGDEGKGAAVQWLAGQNHKYAFSIRVGGDNAEHRFYHKGVMYTNRALPCAWIEPEAKLILGAGHMFNITGLEQEMQVAADALGCDFEDIMDRVLIDRNAGIVTTEHMGQSKAFDRTKRGGTTGRGVGRATVHKVSRDGSFKTAKDYKELSGYKVCNTAMEINAMLMNGFDGLLEGNQGALLSLNHGYYPFNASRDVTPSAQITEAGVGIHRVRDIVAVYRMFPMRVPGASGPTGAAEVPWSQMEEHLGYPLSESVKRQTWADGTKGDYERMFEWSWDDFRHSLAITSPTVMVLTFVDWFDPTMKGKTRWAELSEGVKVHVLAMEEAAMEVLGREVRVRLIKTGASDDDQIKR